jgi:hypothetical protein
MGVKGLWIFQKGFLEGAETCWKGLYVCVFAPLCQYEEKIRTIAWRHLSIIRDCWKNGNSVRKITPH